MVLSDPDFIITDKQITTISTQRRWIHQTQPQIPGISEEERQRRRESNKLTTRINFIGWILEVAQLRQSKGNLEYPVPFHYHHLATFRSTLLGGFLKWSSFLPNSNYGPPYFPMECLTTYYAYISYTYVDVKNILHIFIVSKHISRPWVSS